MSSAARRLRRQVYRKWLKEQLGHVSKPKLASASDSLYWHRKNELTMIEDFIEARKAQQQQQQQQEAVTDEQQE